MPDDAKTVLIVDDDADFQLQQKLQLERAGFTVHTCDTAKEGGEWLATNCPDLAVFDLMMEEEDAGFMLCHEARKRHPNLPIIMVTAVASEAGIDFDASTDEERSWIKADALLEKPIRFEQLKAEIDKLLR